MEYLLNTVRCESDRVAFHGVRSGLVRKQAELLEIPLLQKHVGDDDYKERFLDALDELGRKGVTMMVFGDIDIDQNRGWCESVCREARIEPYFPLWGGDQRALLQEFIESGFKAVVVSIDSTQFDKSALGSPLDLAWLEKIQERRRLGSPLTFCGENGEYHSFVFDGPLFRAPLGFSKGESVFRQNHWLIDLV